MHNFYSVIIGTELLNGRRVDKHFTFINQELRERGLLHVGNFIIEDSPFLIQNCFNMILQDPKSVMFCFGGIGATPDDLTRAIASEVFTGQELSLHVKAKELIESQFGKEAYPHRITMAMLPPEADLLTNVINNVPGFSLFNRFFFTPGFPSMAWPMVQDALTKHFPSQEKLLSDSFIVESPENDLIEIMQALPPELHFSSLPRFVGEKRLVEIYLAHPNKAILNQWSSFFKKEALAKGKIIKDCC
ncbi:competence/damage-inducible protein A [Sulfurospirillum barnesii]|uniref:Putative nuleotide-utilizing enzyme, moeA n=1 Tax=Sulfurospirillum barnesii (strain ATCC 700032 / DSM 10660 / SES-3) TaxID=760154 RepID=I3XVN7_SULBS|nr:molybdopterin-binding protein [Sulfurospirillum barnesii]AFL68011.1 putative nuleotide-utilizing enzyme, moeA [Sulfurospirillum barnesii SES-3]